MTIIESPSLAPGYADPVHDAQRVFRALLAALAEPGLPRELPLRVDAAQEAGIGPALAAVLLALLDSDTGIAWQTSAAARDWLRFHSGARFVPEAQADFVVVDGADARVELARFAQGSDEAPERSATLLWTLPALIGGVRRQWRGPGIAGTRSVALPLPDAFWSQWAVNHRRFPQGVDVIFIAPDAVLGLPRSIAVIEEVG